MKDCAWCGMPMEVVNVWTKRDRSLLHETVDLPARIKTVETPMVMARCLNDHWYGGPMADVEEES